MSTAGPDADLERATVLIDLGRYDQAIEHLGRVLSSQPQNAGALCLLAQARLRLTQYPASVAAAEAAIAADPQSEWALRIASSGLQAMGQHRRAVDAARAAVQLAPHSSSTHAQLAFVLAKAQVYPGEASAAADRAVQLAPHTVMAHSAVGAVALARGKRKQARAAYERALAIDPTSATTRNDLALVDMGRGHSSRELALAAGGFSAALGSDPTLEVSRRNIDVVLHNFLSRLSYFLVPAGYIGWLLSAAHNSVRAALWIPLAALVVPAVFAVRFLRSVSPTIRRMLVQSFREPLRGAAVGCAALACLGLLLAASVASLAPGAFLLSLVLGIVTRLLIAKDGRRRGFGRTRRRRWSRG